VTSSTISPISAWHSKRRKGLWKFLEDTVGAVFKGGVGTGIAAGAGVLLLVPGLLPAIGHMVRPLAVGVIKTGVVMYNEAAATVRETSEDIMAEVRAEFEAAGNSAQTERLLYTASQSAGQVRSSKLHIDLQLR
jgi:hypothetical protein